MSELVLLKLGGSIITNKTQPFTARMDVIDRLAAEIKAALDERGDDLQLIIGHGSGSFGHEAAAKYRTNEGAVAADSWLGFAEVAAAAAELNTIVMKALRNAGVPVVTVLGLQLASMLIGAVVVERVFVVHGLGSLLIDAVQVRDLILVQDVVMTLVGLVLAVSFLTDVLYVVIDPRMRARTR